MHYRQLGHSGLLVSEIGVGTMVFGEDSQRSTSPKEAEKSSIAFWMLAGTILTLQMSMLMVARKRLLGEPSVTDENKSFWRQRYASVQVAMDPTI